MPLHSAFWLIGEELVQVENLAAPEPPLVRPEEIALYARAFERLAALALDDSQAQETIAGAFNRLTIRKIGHIG